ncbi:MAG: hypothetical protein SGARI_002043 [Bacillariaceae sp.]
MKIGWPGLLIIEGDDDACIELYDRIRRWAWQYLVMRGEQQEVVPRESTIDDMRKFPLFVEVEDMSTVAEHCRNVGLEALFRTSMKQYDNDESAGDTTLSTMDNGSSYGALVLVDHMNDGKGYRKWLRKSGREVGIRLLIKQFHPGDDYTNRPTILVGILGSKEDIAAFLKRWRTSRVDVDSKNKACLERQMKVLVEGELNCGDLEELMDWEVASSEDKFTVTEDKLSELLDCLL